MNVSPFVGGDDGIRTRGCGGVLHPPPEYHRPIHHDLSDIGSLSRGRAASGTAGYVTMVVAGRSGRVGRKGGSEGNGGVGDGGG